MATRGRSIPPPRTRHLPPINRSSRKPTASRIGCRTTDPSLLARFEERRCRGRGQFVAHSLVAWWLLWLVVAPTLVAAFLFEPSLASSVRSNPTRLLGPQASPAMRRAAAASFVGCRWPRRVGRRCRSEVLPAASPRRFSPSNSVLCSYSGTEATSSRETTNTKGNALRRRFVYYLGVGSNVGDRFDNVRRAIRLLEEECYPLLEADHDESAVDDVDASLRLKVTRTSFLYETPPMYLSEQPHFLNAAIRVEGEVPAEGSHGESSLSATRLLHHIKRVERRLGRELQNSPSYVRNGPRPIDLDILMGHYYHESDQSGAPQHLNHQPVVFDSENLTVPHPRISERRFVLVPLQEVAGREYRHPTLNATMGELLKNQIATNGEAATNTETRVLPLPRQRFLHLNRTLLMGILNVTPDSFSDGNKYNASVEEAASQALAMGLDGADIVDVGGESTRPGAAPVDVEDELSRVIPVVRRIRSLDPNLPISIDTRNSRVAREAVEAGADIVNDVSAGRYDPNMFRTVADLGVPMILMHMRGTPETMRSMASYDESRGGVVSEVSREIEERCQAAEAAGIHRWMQIVDPGIGFAKTLEQNLQLLRSLDHLRSTTGNVPILLGTSRKGFLGSLTGVADPSDRDPGTIASVVASLCMDRTQNACNIVRVHNVAACKQAIHVMDAIRYKT